MQFQHLIENIPKSPGVYQMFDAEDRLLYVGKAKNLSARLHQYVHIDKLPYHIGIMRRQVSRIEIITTKTEEDALLLEADFIKNKKPKYNILLTDDKMYPMLALTRDKFPRIHKFRGRVTQKKDVFGPYPSVTALNETIKLVQKVCQIRTCTNSFMNNRTRPCLLYQIGRCSAPCTNLISHSDYDAAVLNTRKILSGNIAPVVRDLSAKMQSASEKQEFETAAKIRDQIRSLSDTAARGKKDTRSADFFVGDFENNPTIIIARLQAGQWISNQTIYPKQTDGMNNADIMEQAILWFYSEKSPNNQIITNIKMPLLDGIDKFNIKYSPDDSDVQRLCSQISLNRRVFGAKQIKWDAGIDALSDWLGFTVNRADVFDNSHLFGKSPVGAMIVFGPDGFIKQEYRHYKLKDQNVAGNDIGMMREFLMRTYSKPDLATDLLIVDGGRAQWNIAQSVLSELNLNIPVLGITKGEVRDGDEHFIMPDGKTCESVPKDSILFLLLRAVRDEAHRFAITFHKKTRGKAATTSALDEIDGIGPARRRALLHHFGAVSGIAKADVKALSNVHGISKDIAQKIYFYFHPENVV